MLRYLTKAFAQNKFQAQEVIYLTRLTNKAAFPEGEANFLYKEKNY